MIAAFERMQALDGFVRTALECSVYVAPLDHGLTYEELLETGARLGFQKGELTDAIDRVGPRRTFGDSRIRLPNVPLMAEFIIEREPDFRNVHAFEFVNLYLQRLIRAHGRGAGRVPRKVLVGSGVAEDLPEHDIEVAISMYLASEHFIEKDGYLTFGLGRENYALPSVQVSQNRIQLEPDQRRRQTYEAVKDAIQRRTDGRPPSADPLVAFEASLERLGHGRFRIWWSRTLSELSVSNPVTTPLSTCVLAAALAEGALTFVVGRARDLGLATMNSKTFQESSTRWKFEDLLASASAGGKDAIFDPKLRERADRLNRIRQRIHVGRLMAEKPSGPIPDTRPEEAEEALETVKMLLRRILDWLDEHPSPEGTPA